MKIKENQKAPDFTLINQDQRNVKLSDFLGQWVLIYFYPKDDTPGCTKEACGIRDMMPRFEKNELVVLGVSTDSAESHKRFIEKYHLPFDLLSDSDKEIVKLYGVWGKKKFMGREYMGTLRSSFLINPSGEVVKIYSPVKPEIHAEEVLKDIQLLQAKS